ncbi:MAG: hypothetical protein QOK19_1637 [Solirubrobacteraceae bacterium]|jgi:uncharacterized protein (DUF2236 family)|nr:hypothetical protein [Solirubrobacterales bacterium]MEA2216076.1 hypothetical protein [Solirubrobacteraceae bacterium]
MIRRIHGERAVAISGARALLMQAAHPLAVFGLLSHSSALEEPYDRLGRTAQVMNTIVFGTRAEADAIAKRIRAMHRRVSGRLPTALGPYPAGTPYRADDPALLMWVLYTLVDSAAVLYSRYVRPLSDEQRAAFWEDYKVVGRLFGLRRADMPVTLADLDAYGRRMLEGDELLVTDWARERARQIVLSPPVPAFARPALETANFVTIALLPDAIREQYRFSSLPPQALRKALVAGGAEYFRRAVLPFMPGRLRLTPGARADA